jgi:hypothetical protein
MYSIQTILFGIEQLLSSLIFSIIVSVSGRLNRLGGVGHVARRSAARNVKPIYISLGESKFTYWCKNNFKMDPNFVLGLDETITEVTRVTGYKNFVVKNCEIHIVHND